MTQRSFLGDMLTTLFERRRSESRAKDGRSLEDMCLALLDAEEKASILANETDLNIESIHSLAENTSRFTRATGIHHWMLRGNPTFIDEQQIDDLASTITDQTLKESVELTASVNAVFTIE